VCSAFLLLLVLTIVACQRYGRGSELFPTTEPRRATVTVQYPQGTYIAKTDETIRLLEAKLKQFKDIKFYQTNVGFIPMRGWGGQSGGHGGSIAVEFLKAGEREGNTLQLVEDLRKEIGTIPGAEIVVEREREGPPAEAPISIELTGDDFDELADLAARVKQAVAGVPGLVDLKDDFEEALPEIQFIVDRQRAALLGLDTSMIGEFLRTSIYGTESSKFRAGEDEFDITVRLPAGSRSSPDLLAKTFIPARGGVSVPLSSLGRTVFTSGPGEIRRKDQKRVITVTGDIQSRSVDAVLADVQAAVGKLHLPMGYKVTYAGENADMKESGAFLAKALAVGVGLIAVIMVLQFNSAVLPLLIMVSILLSMIGVAWGLILCRMRFGFIMTGLGVISLAGVVVNNSIVLLDCTLQRRREGMSAMEAAVTAGRLRLRPVLLTAGTTVLGLIPMAVGWSLEIHTWPWTFTAGAESSAWWAPMAVAVIFGLTMATVLTLVQMPVMYSLTESFKTWCAEMAARHGLKRSTGE
jgi:multidrug efflux pump subunit AcrB